MIHDISHIKIFSLRHFKDLLCRQFRKGNATYAQPTNIGVRDFPRRSFSSQGLDYRRTILFAYRELFHIKFFFCHD